MFSFMRKATKIDVFTRFYGIIILFIASYSTSYVITEIIAKIYFPHNIIITVVTLFLYLSPIFLKNRMTTSIYHTISTIENNTFVDLFAKHAHKPVGSDITMASINEMLDFYKEYLDLLGDMDKKNHKVLKKMDKSSIKTSVIDDSKLKILEHYKIAIEKINSIFKSSASKTTSSAPSNPVADSKPKTTKRSLRIFDAGTG